MGEDFDNADYWTRFTLFFISSCAFWMFIYLFISFINWEWIKIDFSNSREATSKELNGFTDWQPSV